MLSHCEKMIISPLPNEWPQQQIDETGFMASSDKIMEKPGQEQGLKCPRCDSSNTKFCYYNNYSLSQPRHFCKACKRYWTRGGTLRNVPVGGGCRKNKRVKRSSSNDASSSSCSSALGTPTQTPPPVSTASTNINPLFYSLPSLGNPSDINNLPFSSSGYDLQSRLNDYRAGFNSSSQIQEMGSTNPLFSGYSFHGSSSAPSTASLIASSLHQQQKLMQLGGFKDGKSGNNNNNHFQALLSFEDLHMDVMKEVKLEERNNRISCQNPMESLGSVADPSLYWNTTSVGSWADLNNFGSSVSPLI